MLKIEFETDNAAFDDAPATETARILRQIARDIEQGYNLGGAAIYDTNGNRIGQWSLSFPAGPVYPDDTQTAE